MSTTQSSPQRSQASSTTSSPSTMRTLVLLGISYKEDNGTIRRELRNQYVGVENVSRVYLRNNDGEFTDAIRIDFKSDKLAADFLSKGAVQISNKPYFIQSSTKSVIVSKVTANDKAKLLHDLSHNYLGVEDARRFLDVNGDPVNILCIDFKSASSTTTIFKDNYILIDGKRHVVQAWASLVCDPSKTKQETAIETPQQRSVTNSPKPANGHSQKPVNNHWQKPTNDHSQKSVNGDRQQPVLERPVTYLTEQRVRELFQQQQMQLESMINEFENKWNARLTPLSTASVNPHVDQLSPVFQELTTVCQQFSQQNAQMQRQLGAVVNQVQNVQAKLNNDPSEQTWPTLSTQNGH